MKALNILLAISLCSQLFSSCQKEYESDGTTQIRSTEYLKKIYSNYIFKSTNFTLSINPDWESTKWYGDEVVITPVILKKTSSSERIETNSFLVYKRVEGDYLLNVYSVITQKKSEQNENVEALKTLENKLLDGKEIATGMTIIETKFEDFISFICESKTNGDAVVKRMTETVGESSSQQNRNNLSCNSEQLICIDWYWVTYVNGVLTDEQYLYTTCQCPDTGTGSGGVNNPPLTPQQICTNNTSLMVAQGSVMSQTMSEIISGEDQYGYNITYSWLIYSAGPWGLISYEDARVKKIPSINNSYIKAYETFTHRNIAPVGVTVGGTRTGTDMGATINIAQSAAEVRIDFTVTHKPLGCLPFITPHNANKTFRLINNVVIE